MQMNCSLVIQLGAATGAAVAFLLIVASEMQRSTGILRLMEKHAAQRREEADRDATENAKAIVAAPLRP